MTTYLIEAWDRQEHWYFETTLVAKDETSARVMFAKEYGRTAYIKRIFPSMY